MTTTEIWQAIKDNPEAKQTINNYLETKTAEFKNLYIQTRKERVSWYYAGYDAGTKDDPAQLNHLGKPSTLEERKIKAATAYSIKFNKDEILPL